MKQAIFTIDIEPDIEESQGFKEPVRYNNAMKGLDLLTDLLDIDCWTIFAPALAVKQNSSQFKYYFNQGADVGLLFYPEDLNERKKDEPLVHLLRAFEIEREELATLLKIGIRTFGGLGPRNLRIGGYNVNVDLMEWLGEQDFGFEAASSTIPSMINTDGSVDHRLYNHDPWKNGNLIEFPLTVFDGKLECWCSPTPGMGLLDNVFEIIRIANYFHYNIDAGDLVGKTLRCPNAQLAESVNDRIYAVVSMLDKYSVVKTKMSSFELPDDAPVAI